MASIDEPRPGSTLSIDRRVERLEAQVSALVVDVGVIQTEVKHTREMVKFGNESLAQSMGALNQTVNTLSGRLESFMQQYQQAMLQGTAMMGDPASTPAGRLIVERINEVEKFARKTAADEAAAGRRWAYAAGAAAAAAIALQIVGIALRFIPV